MSGFRELSRVPQEAFLGTVKVTFINAQGLLEAGIDEKGVFKVRLRSEIIFFWLRGCIIIICIVKHRFLSAI